MTTLRLLSRIGGSHMAIAKKQTQLQLHIFFRRALITDFYINNSKNFKYCTYYASNKHYSENCLSNRTKVSTQQWTTLLPYSETCNMQYISTHCRYFGKKSPDRANKSDTKASAALTESELFGETSNLGLFAKFKLMYKKYWYVLIPVHVITSAFWFGGFYYMSTSGVDIPSLLNYINVSESIIDKVRNSHMGHLAIAYLCYKIATPLRYAVTLGGTTFSIKYLVQAGYIKPMPSKSEIIQMYEQKRADIAAAKADKVEKELENKLKKKDK